jgi:hypothetical protein
VAGNISLALPQINRKKILSENYKSTSSGNEFLIGRNKPKTEGMFVLWKIRGASFFLYFFFAGWGGAALIIMCLIGYHIHVLNEIFKLFTYEVFFFFFFFFLGEFFWHYQT